MAIVKCVLCQKFGGENMQLLTDDSVHVPCLNEYVWRQTGCDCPNEEDVFVCPGNNRYSFVIIDDPIHATRVDMKLI